MSFTFSYLLPSPAPILELPVSSRRAARPLLPVAVLLACAVAGAARAPRLCAALLLPLACSQGGGHGRRQCRSSAREGGRPTVGFERIEAQEGGVELGLFQISNLSLT